MFSFERFGCEVEAWSIIDHSYCIRDTKLVVKNTTTNNILEGTKSLADVNTPQAISISLSISRLYYQPPLPITWPNVTNNEPIRLNSRPSRPGLLSSMGCDSMIAYRVSIVRNGWICWWLMDFDYILAIVLCAMLLPGFCVCGDGRSLERGVEGAGMIILCGWGIYIWC